jgi:hypothetical protein
MRRVIDICLVIATITVLAYGCAEIPGKAGTNMNSVRDFSVGGTTLRIDESDLEQIRQAVVASLEKANAEPHKTLARELAGAIAVLGPDDSRLGAWALVNRDESLALVRVPPRSSVNYIVVATLARRDQRWTVVELFQERMRAL